MGHYPEAAISRRFRCLNMLNLLSLQAELIDMQVRFRDIWDEDERSTEENESQFSTYFRKLWKSEDSLQHTMLLDIRRKLVEYSTSKLTLNVILGEQIITTVDAALVQMSQVQRLSDPEPENLRFLREWLGGLGQGENFLNGSEQFTWELHSSSSSNEHKFLAKDLLTLHSVMEEQDMFSKLISSSLLDIWNWLRVRISPNRRYQNQQGTNLQKTMDPNSGVLHYNDATLIKVNNIIVSVVGASMPVVAIVALYFIKTEGGRLWAMTGFTILFALVLATCTNARRLEIAASTAA
jgi:hypothetical protein